MAINSFESAPPAGGNEMMGEGAGSPVPCVHIYAMPDGTFGLKRSEEPPPEGLESAGDMDTVMRKVAEMLAAPNEQEAGDAMAAAKVGYAKRANRQELAAPGGLFGE